MSSPDRRLNAYRADLAETALRSKVNADRYTDGVKGRIGLPVVPARLMPDRSRPRDTEYLMGEPVTVFDRADGWAWVKSRRDDYVGYVDWESVVYDAPSPTHRIAALRSHLYPAPELKRYAVAALTFGAEVTVVATNGSWSQLADGQWVASAHLRPVDDYAEDPTEEALKFLGVPYLWGGRSSEGMDCSALIQFALEACGIACPRDADMQESMLGQDCDPDPGARRKGDLVYWPGHTGMMIDSERIVHTNATDMATRIWPLARLTDHILRIEGNPVRSVRRL